MATAVLLSVGFYVLFNGFREALDRKRIVDPYNNSYDVDRITILSF